MVPSISKLTTKDDAFISRLVWPEVVEGHLPRIFEGDFYRHANVDIAGVHIDDVAEDAGPLF
jgi:hypothetical protein